MKFARIIFANLLRKKVRLLLTLGSFAVALFLFAFLAVVKDAFNGNSESISKMARQVKAIAGRVGA